MIVRGQEIVKLTCLPVSLVASQLRFLPNFLSRFRCCIDPGHGMQREKISYYTCTVFSVSFHFHTVLLESVEKTELLVQYHVLVYTVYTGGGDPHGPASPAYFCMTGKINPSRSQTVSWAVFPRACHQFHIDIACILRPSLHFGFCTFIKTN